MKDYIALEHSQSTNEKYVVVNWCLGNTCNFACSYCPKSLHDGSTPWPSLQSVISFCEKVIAHCQNKTVYFEFTGGEVTLWKDLIPVAQFLKSKGAHVGIISNGSRSLDFWNKLAPNIDHVCLSFHPETSKADHFFQIAELCSQQIRTHLNFMMHPSYFEMCLNLADRIKTLENVSIGIQPLVKDFGEELFPYTDEQKEIINMKNATLSKQIVYTKKYTTYRGSMNMIRENGERTTMSPQRFIASQANSWKGWYCYAGVEQFVVDLDGTVFRGWCKVGGSLGKITDTHLILPTQPILCDKDFCHCNLDIMTTKKKSLSKPSLQENALS